MVVSESLYTHTGALSGSDYDLVGVVHGFHFNTDLDGQITDVWAFSNNGANAPSTVALYPNAGGAAISTQTPTWTRDGGTGWYHATLGTPIGVTAGTEYRLAILSGNTYRYNAIAPNAGAAHITRVASGSGGSYYAVSSVMTFPDTSGSSFEYYDLTVEFGGLPSPPGDSTPTTYGILKDELTRWESSDAGLNTHQTDLPWLTKAQADAIKAVVDLIKTGVDNVPKAGDSDWVTIKKLWQIAGALTDTEIAAWNLFAQRAPSQLTGVGGQGGSAFFGGHGTQVADNAETLVERQTLMLSTFPASPWALIDTTAFDTSLAWDVDADLYTVSFSDTGSAIVNTLASGVDVCYRLAWWAPLNGSNGYQRGFIDFPTAHCYYGGQRMPGIVLFAVGGGSGTVEAWRYA